MSSDACVDLHVANLPLRTSEDALRALVRSCCPDLAVQRVTLKRGFAFVRVTAATAVAAIKCLDQAPFGPTRRRLRVTLARAPVASAKRKHAGGGGGDGGGGGGGGGGAVAATPERTLLLSNLGAAAQRQGAAPIEAALRATLAPAGCCVVASGADGGGSSCASSVTRMENDLRVGSSSDTLMPKGGLVAVRALEGAGSVLARFASARHAARVKAWIAQHGLAVRLCGPGGDGAGGAGAAAAAVVLRLRPRVHFVDATAACALGVGGGAAAASAAAGDGRGAPGNSVAALLAAGREFASMRALTAALPPLPPAAVRALSGPPPAAMAAALAGGGGVATAPPARHPRSVLGRLPQHVLMEAGSFLANAGDLATLLRVSQRARPVFECFVRGAGVLRLAGRRGGALAVHWTPRSRHGGRLKAALRALRIGLCSLAPLLPLLRRLDGCRCGAPGLDRALAAFLLRCPSKQLRVAQLAMCTSLAPAAGAVDGVGGAAADDDGGDGDDDDDGGSASDQEAAAQAACGGGGGGGGGFGGGFGGASAGAPHGALEVLVAVQGGALRELNLWGTWRLFEGAGGAAYLGETAAAGARLPRFQLRWAECLSRCAFRLRHLCLGNVNLKRWHLELLCASAGPEEPAGEGDPAGGSAAEEEVVEEEEDATEAEAEAEAVAAPALARSLTALDLSSNAALSFAAAEPGAEGEAGAVFSGLARLARLQLLNLAGCALLDDGGVLGALGGHGAELPLRLVQVGGTAMTAAGREQLACLVLDEDEGGSDGGDGGEEGSADLVHPALVWRTRLREALLASEVPFRRFE